jgi:hypothetical protein
MIETSLLSFKPHWDNYLSFALVLAAVDADSLDAELLAAEESDLFFGVFPA